jgi:hypothetical protein
LQSLKKGSTLYSFKKITTPFVLFAALAAMPVIGHAYPADEDDCKAAAGTWIDFKTTPADGWCRGAVAMPNGPVIVCAKAKGIEQRIGSEMVCIPRDAARQQLLKQHDKK